MKDFDDEQYKAIRDLLMACQVSHTFIFEGCLIRGHDVALIKQYIRENPSKKFFIWLQDTGKIITQDITGIEGRKHTTRQNI